MSLPPAKICCDTRSADPPAAAIPPAHPATRTRILFVDDEAAILKLWNMSLHSMAAEWDVEFAGNGEEALALVRRKAFDVIVTDMRMPGMNGVQLLNQVLQLHPQTIRIILSGYAELSTTVKSIGITHQFLEKPLQLADLKKNLKRLLEARARIHHDELCGLIARLKNLPGLPALYLQIAAALESPEVSTEQIAELASTDPALTAKLLQLSNSAFFGSRRKVYSVAEAVQVLGINLIQSLALAVPLFAAFDRAKLPGFPIEQLWNHSAQTGAVGRQIFNQFLRDPQLAELAFTAGILHDIGKLILADGLPKEYAAVLAESRNTKTPLFLVEQEHFQTTHAEVGAYLLALWGLPIPLVEAVACHHEPGRCGNRELCLAGGVHIANALQHAQAAHPEMIASPVNTDYLQHVDLAAQFEIWRAELVAGQP